MKDPQELKKEIEYLQKELNKKIDSGMQLTSDEVIEISTRLDSLLNKFSSGKD